MSMSDGNHMKDLPWDHWWISLIPLNYRCQFIGSITYVALLNILDWVEVEA